MATLKDASMIITIPAPIQSAGITDATAPALGKNKSARDESNAPTKK